MFVILSAQVLNRSSLQRNGHGLACKLREFALGGNGHGPVEQIDEVNIPNSATGHENERVYMSSTGEGTGQRGGREMHSSDAEFVCLQSKKTTNNPTPRLPQEVGILRDVSRQPACPPPQAPSSIYLHRDDPSTQAPIPRTATQHKGILGPGF